MRNGSYRVWVRSSLKWLALALQMCVGIAHAHHSFPVHFIGERTVSVAGTVTEFRFRNPHGIIFLEVSGTDGAITQWKIETNSPNILRRRGWTPESLTAGDRVSIVGFPARDGSKFLRVYRVSFDDGRELIGQRPVQGIEQ